MANKGMTIKQGFERALTDYKRIGDETMIAFFEGRLSQLEKNNNAPKSRTPRQIENDAYKEIILNGMNTGLSYSIDDMLMYFGLPLEMKPQRVSALITQLIDENKVKRVGKDEYKHTIYTIVCNTGDE